MVKTIHLCKFDPLYDQEAEPVTIVIDREIGEQVRPMSFEECNDFYNKQADALVEALYGSLPQATFDRVALRMFAKKMKSNLYIGQVQLE